MTFESLAKEDDAAKPPSEVSPPDSSFQGYTAPSSELLDELEAVIVMPQYAYKISEYHRQYTFVKDEGRTIVIGAFRSIRRGEIVGVRTGVPSSRFEGNPADGGCGFVNVYYDPAKKKFLLVGCGAEG